MTTFISIRAHAGVPVEVTPYTFALDADGKEVGVAHEKAIIVPADKTEGFHVYCGRGLNIRELPNSTI